jgi:subtilisin-like proprotein convertase family protein
MRTIILIIIFLFVPVLLYPQYQNCKLNPVNKMFYGEECIKINPKNTNQVVAGIMANYSPLTGIMGYCYSTNSGVNWSSSPITCSFAQPGSDPIIIVDTLGNFYYICCANWGVPGPNLDKLLCFKSTNGGMNWDGGTALALMAPQMDDMPMACIDRSHSQYGNNIYVTWSLYDHYTSTNPLDSCYVALCRSSDGGATFSIPVHVSKVAGTARGDNSTPEGPIPCTGPNGEVYVTWPLNETIRFNRSTNAGVNWMQNDVVVCSQVGGWSSQYWPRDNYSPVSACDISNSPYRGNVYICFADLSTGPYDRDIWFVKSTNQGNSWSTKKRINNDGAGNDQSLPWICVDNVTGYIWIVFYDTRGHALNVASPYVALSTNGGETFLNSRLSTSITMLDYWCGDYISIDAYNNKVRPLWTRAISDHNAEVWTTIVDSFAYTMDLSHIPVQSSLDTSAKTVTLKINYIFGLGTGTNAPRLYYKVGNGQYYFVNAFEINGDTYKFRIPGQPPGSKISYYFAVQNSSGNIMATLPEGGSGLNPPGTTPPAAQYTYNIWTVNNFCSNKTKPINDFEWTEDTIHISQQGLVKDLDVSLNINHANDGDLLIKLQVPNNNTTLSQFNGQGGQNYINTIFDDSAATPISQGVPPFTGRFKPQGLLTPTFLNQQMAGDWILRVYDINGGNTGSLLNWCITFKYESTIGIKNVNSNVPDGYKLFQNYPNPFNPVTNIKYQILTNSFVSLKIYDLLGREVATLVNEKQREGEYEATFNGEGLPSGIYFYKIIADGFIDTKRMVLIK